MNITNKTYRTRHTVNVVDNQQQQTIAIDDEVLSKAATKKDITEQSKKKIAEKLEQTDLDWFFVESTTLDSKDAVKQNTI